MPWTVSHAAAVLPLRRFCPETFNFPALVVGSMTPDLGYYINWVSLADLDHTIVGIVLAGLPSALILWLIFYLVRRPVCYLLPSPHRQALSPLCRPLPRGPGRWLMILVALLIGLYSHLFWDAFTHDRGWFVEHWAFLRRPVLRFGATIIYMPLFLQLLSTVVGFLILVAAYFLWLRKQQPLMEDEPRQDRWRYLFWFALGFVTTICAVSLAAFISSEKSGFQFAHALVFNTALLLLDFGVPLLILSAWLIYRRRALS